MTERMTRGSAPRYQSRDPEAYKRRGEQGGGQRDFYLPDNTKTFTPKEGDNTIRILPPYWANPEHYGFDVFIHYDVGADRAAYLCAKEMKHGDGKCPVCEERARATAAKDDDYAKKLKPNKRVFTWIIDRDNERESPMLWSMPWTIDRDICKLAYDKRHGEALQVDDPDHGYDILFERKGKGERTEYIGIQIARRESPLGNDRWLEFVQKNPIPEILTFYDYSHILNVFNGATGAAASPQTGQPERAPTAAREPRAERTGSTPRSSDRALITWENLHGMSWEELGVVAKENTLNIDCKSAKDEQDLASWICELLRIEPAPAPVVRRQGDGGDGEDVRERLRRMRS